jgi:hypothetical protein
VHAAHRRLLLELYRALAPATPAARPAVARACAERCGVPLELELAAAPESAARLAVRMVHQLEMRAAPWCARLGPLAAEAGEAAVLRAALAGAPLIAGRQGRALLAIALDAVDGSAHTGALVDAETCARIALAGGELESAQRGALELLGFAGDLVPALPAGPVPLAVGSGAAGFAEAGAAAAGAAGSAGGAVLLAVLRLEADEAARCLARLPVITMQYKDL